MFSFTCLSSNEENLQIEVSAEKKRKKKRKKKEEKKRTGKEDEEANLDAY